MTDHRAFSFISFLIATASLVEIQCSPLPNTALSLSFGHREGNNHQDQLGSHSVSCNLDTHSTVMDKVTSLTLHGAKPFGKPGQFDALATVNLWSPQAKLLLDGLGATDVEVYGRIGTGDIKDSQLTVSWGFSSPATSFPRQYRCVVNGLDRVGQVLTMSITSDTSMFKQMTSGHAGTGISNQTAVVQDLFNRSSQETLKPLETKLQNLTSQVDQVQETVDSLTTLVDTQTINNQRYQQTLLEELRRLKVASLSPTFDISREFKGKRYFVSKTIAPFNIDIAGLQCELIGGYLLEMDDKEEYDFVFDFVKGLEGNNFFTGANDIAKEGEWKFWHSGKDVSYANWKPGQPNNYQNNEDCLEIRVNMAASNDWHCTAEAKFVCEVPA